MQSQVRLIIDHPHRIPPWSAIVIYPRKEDLNGQIFMALFVPLCFGHKLLVGVRTANGDQEMKIYFERRSGKVGRDEVFLVKG